MPRGGGNTGSMVLSVAPPGVKKYLPRALQDTANQLQSPKSRENKKGLKEFIKEYMDSNGGTELKDKFFRLSAKETYLRKAAKKDPTNEKAAADAAAADTEVMDVFDRLNEIEKAAADYAKSKIEGKSGGRRRTRRRRHTRRRR